MTKGCILMKIKPGKETNIWFALAIMKSLKIDPKQKKNNTLKAPITDVNFVSGPYDLEFILEGNHDDIVRSIFNIREEFGKAEWIDDTLTLISYDLPITNDQVKEQYSNYCGGKDLSNQFNNNEIKFDELCGDIPRNENDWINVLGGLLKGGI